MKEQSVLSFDNIPLCEMEAISPIGSNGSFATTIPYLYIIIKILFIISYLIDAIKQTHEKHHE